MSAYTVRTLQLEMAHAATLAAALRVLADVRRNVGEPHKAAVFEAAAALIEQGVDEFRRLRSPERVATAAEELVEKAVTEARRATLRVVPPASPPTKPTRASKRTGRAARASKDKP